MIMKKFILSLITILLCYTPVFAEGAVNVHSAIDSRIFSTQGAQPFETLERTNYTNSAIMNLEDKSSPRPEIQKNENIIPEEEPKGLKGLFKGFRVIW